MVIKSLEIKNFKSYRGLNKIDLKGLNIISGSIGSGKHLYMNHFNGLLKIEIISI